MDHAGSRVENKGIRSDIGHLKDLFVVGSGLDKCRGDVDGEAQASEPASSFKPSADIVREGDVFLGDAKHGLKRLHDEAFRDYNFLCVISKIGIFSDIDWFVSAFEHSKRVVKGAVDAGWRDLVGRERPDDDLISLDGFENFWFGEGHLVFFHSSGIFVFWFVAPIISTTPVILPG